MKHGDQIATYVIKFDQLALLTQWGDPALWHQFYVGLPRRIKDDMVHHTYVNSLAGVKSVAWLIDAWYWKCEGEKEREKNRDRGSRDGGNSGNTAGNTGRSGNPPGGQKGGGKKGPSKQNPSPMPAARLKGSSKQAGNSGPAATGVSHHFVIALERHIRSGNGFPK
jgi:hypothetical protein